MTLAPPAGASAVSNLFYCEKVASWRRGATRNDICLLFNQPNPHQEFQNALGKCGFFNQT
jgi:hypothetical protein